MLMLRPSGSLLASSRAAQRRTFRVETGRMTFSTGEDFCAFFDALADIRLHAFVLFL